MPDPVIVELMARIEELESAAVRPGGRTVGRRVTRQRRVALSIVALAGLLLVPVGVFASHQFTDVPNSNTFHSSISKVKLAGITSGCSATKFCPNDSVTRGQMAAFLARSAPRAETAFFDGATLEMTEFYYASFDIKAGEGTGGTAAIAVDASVSVSTLDASGCPCTAAFYIYSDSSPYTSYLQYATVTDTNIDIPDDATYGIATTSITVLLYVPTGVTETVYLVGYMVDGTPLQAWGEMVGTVGLFDGVGNNVVMPTTSAGVPTSGPGGRVAR